MTPVTLPPEAAARIRELFEEANRAAVARQAELARPLGEYNDRIVQIHTDAENWALYRITCLLRPLVGAPDRPVFDARQVSAVLAADRVDRSEPVRA